MVLWERVGIGGQGIREHGRGESSVGGQGNV